MFFNILIAIIIVIFCINNILYIYQRYQEKQYLYSKDNNKNNKNTSNNNSFINFDIQSWLNENLIYLEEDEKIPNKKIKLC